MGLVRYSNKFTWPVVDSDTAVDLYSNSKKSINRVEMAGNKGMKGYESSGSCDPDSLEVSGLLVRVMLYRSPLPLRVIGPTLDPSRHQPRLFAGCIERICKDLFIPTIL